MLRNLIRRLTKLGIYLGIAGLIAAGALTLTTHYLFQEPAHVTWSRYLAPEIRWQKQKYPSVEWAFNILEWVFVRTDPRDRFDVADAAPPLPNPAAWDSDLAGPQAPQAGDPGPAGQEAVVVASTQGFRAALKSAQPGTVIQILPGEYEFSGRALTINRPGEPDNPIVLRAAELGTVQLKFDLLEGFHVLAPNWTFENLVIDGVCERDSACEHAFHVVGEGAGVVIRNNWVTNFNAPVKVNAANGKFPDGGLLLSNAFINERPRQTSNSVTTLDIVAASGWRVQKNVIADFAKDGGDRTSYGAFFKGAGENNIFEQNLVRCEWRHRGGTRVGFSFGGGGTTDSACRDGKCGVEHRNGIVRNNIIMNCPNDVAIYLNKSADTQVHNNLLINTRGIDVRFEETDAVILNNIIDGRILSRNGGTFSEASNIVSAFNAVLLSQVSADVYSDPQKGDFRLNDLEEVLGLGTAIEDGGLDICNQPYKSAAPDIGPIQYGLGLSCTPVIK